MRAIVAGDREAFYATEIEARRRTGYPPFGRLASLIISGARSSIGRRSRGVLLAGAALPAEAVRVLGRRGAVR
jgi:primosomal protein N' (replication factor Y)